MSTRPRPRLRVALVSIAIVVLSACAATGPYDAAPAAAWLASASRPDGAERARACVGEYHRVDRAVDAQSVRDGSAPQVPGFPYLRVDRFLASFAGDPQLDPASPRFDAAAFERWVVLMSGLDSQARAHELANLDLGAAGLNGARDALAARLDACARVLAHADLSDSAGRALLLRSARVAPDYVTAQRVAGLYPLTAIPFLAGVRAYQRDTIAEFAGFDRGDSPAAASLRYSPATGERARVSRASVATDTVRHDALGIPRPTDSELEALFAAHAPIFEVEWRRGSDSIGALRWAAMRPAPGSERRRVVAVVDAAEPVVYRRLAFTRSQGRVLMQLVYTAWFAQRPRTGALDLLGGDLDALVWRVTLGPGGEPILYDSMHACGCYHMFFPTAELCERPRVAGLDEGALVPQRVAPRANGERIVLRVQSGTHYLRQVLREPAGDGDETVRVATGPAAAGGRGSELGYRLVPDDSLRSTGHPDGGSRSVYRPDGIVAGSERAERWLFWPMGVREPGAMRQWGRHATAFVGQRHFDDPDLIDRHFAARPQSASAGPALCDAPPSRR